MVDRSHRSHWINKGSYINDGFTTSLNGFVLGSALESPGVDEYGTILTDFPNEGELEWWYFQWYRQFFNTSSRYMMRKQQAIEINNRPSVVNHTVRDDTNDQTATAPFPASGVWTLLGHRYSANDGTFDVHHNDNTTAVGTTGGITGAPSDFSNTCFWFTASAASGFLRQRCSNSGLFAYSGTAPSAGSILSRIYNGGNPTDLNADADSANLKGYWYFDSTLGDTALKVFNRASTGSIYDIDLVNFVIGDYKIGGQPPNAL